MLQVHITEKKKVEQIVKADRLRVSRALQNKQSVRHSMAA